MTTELKKLKAGRWLVIVGGVEAGLVEKAPTTKDFLNPYKAYRGIGTNCAYMGSFYDRTEATKWGMADTREGIHDGMRFGGKQAAIAAVTAR